MHALLSPWLGSAPLGSGQLASHGPPAPALLRRLRPPRPACAARLASSRACAALGFAFIEYDDRRDAEDAIRAMDRKRFFGQEIRVEFSKTEAGPRRRRDDGPYGGGGGHGGGGYGGYGFCGRQFVT